MINVEAKAAHQPLIFLKNMDTLYTKGHWLFAINDFKKKVESKKSPSLSLTNYISRQFSQPVHGPSIFRLNKKNSQLR